MSFDVFTYALARKYVDKAINGLGAIKGAPCEISSIEETEDASIITFRWTGADGTEKTQQLVIPRGFTDDEQAAFEAQMEEIRAIAEEALEKAEDSCDCVGGSINAIHDGQGNVTMEITGLKMTSDGAGNVTLG